MIKILIADDHQILLDGLSRIIEDIPDMQLVGTSRNGNEVIKIMKDLAVDVVLLDINMPELNGVEACKQISKKYPNTRLIALSIYKRQSYITRMFQFGAMGYLLKDDRAQEIEKAIRVVLNGDRYFISQIKIEINSLLERDQKKVRSVLGN